MSCLDWLSCTPRTKFLKTTLLITTLLLQMTYHCGWISFGELLGVKMGAERLPKTMCKTYVNFEAILDAFWRQFGILFRLRMVGPCKNFRSSRCSLAVLALGRAPVGPRGRFW